LCKQVGFSLVFLLRDRCSVANFQHKAARFRPNFAIAEQTKNPLVKLTSGLI
jgi:hypothetical protein